MLTKREQELIRSLQSTKHREREGLFVAEGLRLVGDMLGAFACAMLVVTESLYLQLERRLLELPHDMRPKRLIKLTDGVSLARLSSLSSPQGVLALFALPNNREALQGAQLSGLTLMLDRIQDPGNMGTILRTADWFGVEQVLLVSGCTDPYAPKVVQATMGALARLKLHRLPDDGAELLRGYRGVSLGTFLGGENLYQASLPQSESEPTMLIMGNEGNGISDNLGALVSQRITIPHFAPSGSRTESLNVAVATAICLSELRRPRTLPTKPESE